MGHKVIVVGLELSGEGVGPTALEFPLERKEGPVIKFSLKEGANYRLGIRFYVQHDIALGLKLSTEVVKFKVTVSRDVFVVGSYAPATEPYTFKTPEQVAPSGMLARGSYQGTGRVHDDDGNVYTEFTYNFEIQKKKR